MLAQYGVCKHIGPVTGSSPVKPGLLLANALTLARKETGLLPSEHLPAT